MSIIDFRPSKSLVIKNQSGSPQPNRLILFGNHWVSLQDYVQGALKFAPDVKNFTESYGEFGTSNQALITRAVTALAGVRDLSVQFGNPEQLRQRIYSDPGYLSSDTPPTQVYGHIAWVAGRIRIKAKTFSDTFDVLIESLNEVPVADRPKVIREILGGPTGLIPIATAAKTESKALLLNLSEFEKKLIPHNEEILEYTDKSSELLKIAKDKVSDYQKQIAELQDAADDANRKFLAFTVGAGVAGGAMVLSPGFFLLFPPALLIGGGVVAGLLTAAALQKRRYNELIDGIGQNENEKLKKTRLVTDLEGFNPRVKNVNDSLKIFRNNLTDICKTWEDIERGLHDIVNTYTDEQILALPYPEQVNNVRIAVAEWKAIADAAGDFSTKSLMSYDVSMRFGQKVA